MTTAEPATDRSWALLATLGGVGAGFIALAVARGFRFCRYCTRCPEILSKTISSLRCINTKTPIAMTSAPAKMACDDPRSATLSTIGVRPSENRLTFQLHRIVMTVLCR
ncbi:hypothetical protein [Sphingomonas sp. 10B4]|uniref:hypothetical protein n=1 Tax=Sphingomonas sp. 10B4 TaxID=3048575 RepID=UPI002AB49B3E|nr:hypothetical protein [Sphingomonas sp. 10B4]MDY7523766.1 hypothetical protein [Sphingomonas sp. 10B4]